MKSLNVIMNGDDIVELHPRPLTYEIREETIEKNIPNINSDIISQFIDWAEDSEFVTRYHPFEFEYDFDIQHTDSKYIERLGVPNEFKVFFEAAIKHAKIKENNDKCLTLRFVITKSFLEKHKVPTP